MRQKKHEQVNSPLSYTVKMKKELVRLLSVRMSTVLAHYGIKCDENYKRSKVFCPFHRETQPSFTIYHESNDAYCFGCGKYLSTIDFIREKEKCSFFKALQKLSNIGRLGFSEKIILKIHRKFFTSEKAKKPEEMIGVYKRLAADLRDEFLEYSHQFEANQKFPHIFDYLCNQADEICLGKMNQEKFDQLKDWFFASKKVVKNAHLHWKNYPLLIREIYAERLDIEDDFGI